MVRRLEKIGNNLYLVLTQEELRHIGAHDAVEVSVAPGWIAITSPEANMALLRGHRADGTASLAKPANSAAADASGNLIRHPEDTI
jgi:hypothetical protein